MSSFLHRLRGGIHPAAHKADSGGRPLVTLPLPETLVLPLSQHKGPPATPAVRVGQHVAKGDVIGRAAHPDAAAVHASTSGVVRAIEVRPVANPSGMPELCVVIDCDGEDRPAATAVAPWQDAGADDIRRRLRDAGIVGLGGAAFPSHRKLPTEGTSVRTLVLNGAECEPYISCDDALMRANPEQVVRGGAILAQLLGATEILVAIEDNKPEAAAALQMAARGTALRIVVIPARYPVGAAHQLIYAVTGIEIPTGHHAAECGVQCFNVATAYSVHRALDCGEPLLRRIVTVAGHVECAQNVDALLGTPLDALLDHAVVKSGPVRHTIGGPLMGYALASTGAPVTKSTNCLLTLPAPERTTQVMPCIRCARCAEACPVGLQPHDLYYLCRAGRTTKALDYHLAACIECGACDYVCPSQIPLVAQFRRGKSDVAEQAREREMAQRSRDRFGAHEARMTKEEQATQATLHAADESAAARAVRAALERARSKAPK